MPGDCGPVLLVVAVFGRHAEARAWARERLEAAHGPVALAGPEWAFDQTRYYEASMGPGLVKQLLAFRDLVSPDGLPDLKHAAIALEREAAGLGRWAEARPLNIDPGHLGLAKFVLATTKDQPHRVYLRDGIFAEVTLHYQGGAWEAWPWTYADYRLAEVRAFLAEARAWYRGRLRAVG